MAPSCSGGSSKSEGTISLSSVSLRLACTTHQFFLQRERRLEGGLRRCVAVAGDQAVHGRVLGRRDPRPLAVLSETPGTGSIANREIEDGGEALLQLVCIDADEDFDAPVKVAVHHVGAA